MITSIVISILCLALHVASSARIDYNVIETKNPNEISHVNRHNDTVCSLSEDLINEIKSYQPIVDRIVASVVDGPYSGNTWKGLLEMTDKFGNRMSGTKNLEDTIDYMVEVMKAAGLENVHTEDAPIPHWTRGYEVAQMLTPHVKNLTMLGIGGSVGTQPGGITASLIAVETFDELEKLPSEQVQGKIVLFAPRWNGYHDTVDYREVGPSRAAKRGAVATLARSMTPFSINSVHTGAIDYQPGITDIQIPAATITVENAMYLLRLYRQGINITIHLEMQDQNLPPVMSRNVIGEFIGKLEKPVVVVSGHIDSWDIGDGAADDGGGSYISWKGVELLKKIGLPRPRRTIRAILWTAEEQGYFGAVEYEKVHKADEEKEFDFFIESDKGTFDPKGLDFSGNVESECIFKEILKLMGPLNATEFSTPILAGPDIGQWANRGFPSASLISKAETYYWFHHSLGDSMAVEDPVSLDKDTALFAAAAYVIADLSIDMPKTVKP